MERNFRERERETTRGSEVVRDSEWEDRRKEERRRKGRKE